MVTVWEFSDEEISKIRFADGPVVFGVEQQSLQELQYGGLSCHQMSWYF